jgi:hypothetical protein
VNDVVIMQVTHSLQNLSYNLGGILFGEFSVFADAVKKLSTSGKLGDNVVLVLSNY